MANDIDARVSVARREAREYRSVILWAGGMEGITCCVILAGMAYWGVPIGWLIVAAFAATILILTRLLAAVAERLDAGRAYLEQLGHDMNVTVGSKRRD